MLNNYLMLGVHALGAFKRPFSALSINMSCLLWGMNELIIILYLYLFRKRTTYTDLMIMMIFSLINCFLSTEHRIILSK